MNITICGGGNAAHALAGILGAHEAHQVNVYAPFSDEAKRWQQEMDFQGGLLVERMFAPGVPTVKSFWSIYDVRLDKLVEVRFAEPSVPTDLDTW